MAHYSINITDHKQLREHEIYMDIRRARSLAGWSFIGLILPLIGWILAGMSLSITSSLPESGEIGRKREAIRTTAGTSIFLSIITELIFLTVFLYARSN